MTGEPYSHRQFLKDVRAFRLPEDGLFTSIDVKRRHRYRIAKAHPDKGGSTKRAQHVNAVRERLLAWLAAGSPPWPMPAAEAPPLGPDDEPDHNEEQTPPPAPMVVPAATAPQGGEEADATRWTPPPAPGRLATWAWRYSESLFVGAVLISALVVGVWDRHPTSSGPATTASCAVFPCPVHVTTMQVHDFTIRRLH